MGRADAVFYGLSALLLTGLVYFGWIYPKSVKPDTGMRLSMVGIRLQVLAAIPIAGTDAKASDLRKKTLEDVAELLDQIEEQTPGMGITREYRAYQKWLERDHEQAIYWYRQALAAKNNGMDLIKRVHLNLSLVQLEAGKSLDALKTLEEVPASDRDIRWPLTAAGIHAARKDAPARTRALEEALEKAGEHDALKQSVAHRAYDLGDDMARSLYEAQTNKSPRVRYRIAHLLARAGKIDEAVASLKLLDGEGENFLESRLARDRSFWQMFADRDEFLDKSLQRISMNAGVPGK